MSDLNTPMFSYKNYVNDKQKLTQTGTVDAGLQKQSPKSAGSRGLQRTHEFTNTTVQMMGEPGDPPVRPGPSNPNPNAESKK